MEFLARRGPYDKISTEIVSGNDYFIHLPVDVKSKRTNQRDNGRESGQERDLF
jgi:hypothetical protein